MGPVADGAPWIALRGNHDWLALLWLIDPDAAAGTDRPAAAWLLPGFGGRATLESYGIEGAAEAEGPELWAEARARVPPAHLAYLAALPLWHATPEAVFVHAGLRPGVPLERQSPADILWIRRGFVDVAHDHGRLVVHGHTPLDEPRHFGTRVDLDAGAGYGRPLVAAAVEGRRVWILTEDGRHELTPP
jgi:serine/threonine protein phosphatase 1